MVLLFCTLLLEILAFFCGIYIWSRGVGDLLKLEAKISVTKEYSETFLKNNKNYLPPKDVENWNELIFKADVMQKKMKRTRIFFNFVWCCLSGIAVGLMFWTLYNFIQG